MRADVLAPSISTQPNAHGRPSVGFAVKSQGAVSHDNAPRVAIASWDLLTVHGGSHETWQALLSGASLDDHARVRCVVAADRRASRLARHVASRVLVDRIDPDTAVLVGTSKGPVEDWLDDTMGGLRPSGLGEIADDVARMHGIRGPLLTASAACASGLHALVRGAMMIRAREVRQALVVATEASLHPLFIGSFQRLGVLAKRGAGCRPFDETRAGFYVTEGAAAVLLEAADPTERSGEPRHRIFIDRFAFGGDATHITAGDPNARVLRHLLARVIDGRPVDLIHAHGTGTPMNDATELAAIDEFINPAGALRPPIVYSHKATLGHSLGASGLLSVVINCMCHASGVVPPIPGVTRPLPARRVKISQTLTERPVRRSVALAAGFGGAVAAVSLTS